MHTYTCQTEGLHCDECGRIIPVGDEFAVVSTPSKPYQNNHVDCASTVLKANPGDENHKGAHVETAPGKNQVKT